MGDHVIRIRKRTIERTIYWVIILVLAGLLVWTYFSPTQGYEEAPLENESASEDQVVNESMNKSAPAQEPEETLSPEEECIAGGDYWYDESCHDEPELTLSGELSLTIEEVEVESAGTGAIKASNIEVTIENGLDESAALSVRAFARTTAGLYLNQPDNADDLVPYVSPYEVFPSIESGEERTITIGGGSYVYEQQGYSLGDSFRLLVEVLDEDGEVVVDETTNVS